MEFYVKADGDPNFDPTSIHSESEVAVLLTQLETMLFTNKGEVSEEHQKYLMLLFVIGYLIFLSVITRVPHCCPQPNEIELRSVFFGILK